MAHQSLDSLIRSVHRLAGPAGDTDRNDGELLRRFAAEQDENAFQSLMDRHGSMVLNVCRGVLRDAHDAEDAFQATFLVLARKATSIQKQSSVASWLYGVAHRIALRAKVNAGRRSQRERQAIDMSLEPTACDADRAEMRSVLDEELRRLPDKYRAPLVLCYLEGKTNETAAQELGWPRGSIGRRLTRGRELLRDRLAYRGVALSAAGLGAILAERAASASIFAVSVSHTLSGRWRLEIGSRTGERHFPGYFPAESGSVSCWLLHIPAARSIFPRHLLDNHSHSSATLAITAYGTLPTCPQTSASLYPDTRDGAAGPVDPNSRTAHTNTPPASPQTTPSVPHAPPPTDSTPADHENLATAWHPQMPLPHSIAGNNP